MVDSYRPSRSNRDRPPPLVDRMTFTSGGGANYDSYRPQGAHNRQQNGDRTANHAEFTFSSGPAGPKFPPTGPANAHPPAKKRHRSGAPGQNNQRDSRRAGASNGRGRNNANSFRRGGFRKAAPHERALLQIRDGGSPERALGVPDGSNKFRDLDELSDDEEADMETDSDGSSDNLEEGSKSKLARVQTNGHADGDSVPKWSNPDPYTVLPPPEETTGKRVDVVKLIRKAKNQSAEKAIANNAVAANNDFISFDDDDDEEKLSQEDSPSPEIIWTGSATSRQRPYKGSLNEVAATGVLSTASNNAKRSADAAGLPEKPQHSGKVAKRKRGEFEGGIVQEWLSRPNLHPAPWVIGQSYEHLKHDVSKWLHNEILDFYDYVKPQDHEHYVRSDLWKRINTALGPRRFGNRIPGRIHCFGSFPAGLYLPTADMDLVYASDDYYKSGTPTVTFNKPKDKNNMLWGAARRLRDVRITQEGDYTVIGKAKVPIVKFKDLVTGIQVDLSFENLSGVQAQATFKQWQHDYPDMQYLVALIKQFLVMRGLNDVHTGGLGGFSIICLVVSLIQLRPKRDNLGDLFLDFLDYYGNIFDLATERIVMHPPQVVRKTTVGIDGRAEKADGLSIQDPNKPENNISGGSHKAKHVFHAFSMAHKTLTERMAALGTGQLSEPSILEAIIGGNYESYDQLRSHIRNVK